MLLEDFRLALSKNLRAPQVGAWFSMFSGALIGFCHSEQLETIACPTGRIQTVKTLAGFLSEPELGPGAATPRRPHGVRRGYTMKPDKSGAKK
jgi:hypothetical protein